jgi:tripartite-type tricarboxylate transporter receptor subunit TctC
MEKFGVGKDRLCFRPRSAALALWLATLSALAGAQAFPSKTIRWIVAFPPGGATDIVARMAAAKLTESLGQQVVVDNRAGAAGVVGTDIAAKAPPDGHTWFIGTMGNLTANPTLYKKLPFDVSRDFAPITQVVSVWFILVSHPSLPVKSVKELIAMAKARPGELNYYSSGSGGGNHLAVELFNSMAGTKITHIPYKGSGPGMTDLLAGQVQLTIDSVVQCLPYIKAGKLRAIAITGAKRSPLLPEVPVVGDTVRGYDVTNWFGLVVPAATPPEIRARIHAEVVKVLLAPDFKERLLSMGAEPVGSTPEVFGALLKSETAKWAKVIRDASIQAE